MPASRFTDGGMPVRRADVVGCDGDSSRHYIRHVALVATDNDAVKSGDHINVNHMGPPLERERSIIAHSYATVELNDDELNQIDLFIDELYNEQEAQQRRSIDTYVIHPHTTLSADGSFRRFSCAGFVVEAYAEAGIDLIDIDSDIPLVNLETLLITYAELARIQNNNRLLEKLGLNGDGPWPVLLPGYLFHSMARPVEHIRRSAYQPSAGDERFPRNA